MKLEIGSVWLLDHLTSFPFSQCPQQHRQAGRILFLKCSYIVGLLVTARTLDSVEDEMLTSAMEVMFLVLLV